jgi:hypothetical protein
MTDWNLTEKQFPPIAPGNVGQIHPMDMLKKGLDIEREFHCSKTVMMVFYDKENHVRFFGRAHLVFGGAKIHWVCHETLNDSFYPEVGKDTTYWADLDLPQVEPLW